MTIHNGGTKSLIHGILTYFDNVKQFNEYYKCKCPAHRDEQASLSIREEHNSETGLTKVRLKCHAGCTFDDVLKAAELKRRDIYRHDMLRRIVATYDYTSLTGELLHQTVRFEPKDFSQRRPDGQGGGSGV